ncbi:MAG: ribosomal-protein-alanine N-acetyltransferase [Roseivirga sp.]|jgi:ribosomal-protein-alanine N-acetyltransferase
MTVFKRIQLIAMRILETERLWVEEANADDVEFIYDLLNSPNWLRFIGDRGIRSLDDALEYIESSMIKSYQENGFGLYKLVLKAGQIPIGLCGLLKRPVFDHPDIGFAVLPEYEGKGIVFEAAKAVLEHAQTILKIDTILAITTNLNSRSQNLLSRIGLKMEGWVDYAAQGDFLLYSTKAKNQIEKAQLEDLATLNRIIWEAKQHWGYPDEWMEMWRDELTLQPSDLALQQIYVIKSTEIMGLCAIKEEADHYEIAHLWIDPKHMKEGLGRQLLKTSLALTALNNKPILVEADPNAEAFYQSQGFTTYGKKASQIEGRFLPLMRKEI